MKNWKVSKEFSFCAAHRVWKQELNETLSDNSICACRYVHGHNYTVKVTLSRNELNHQDMVIDFKNLSFIKKFLDETVDHKFLVHKSDPLFYHILPLCNTDGDYIDHKEGHSTINPQLYKDAQSYIQEYYSGIVITDFLITSENLARWIFNVVKSKLSQYNVKLDSVTIYETDKTSSTYEGEQ